MSNGDVGAGGPVEFSVRDGIHRKGPEGPSMDDAIASETGATGLTSLTDDRFARLNLRYPLDVEGPEEGHFIRFTVHSVTGAKLKTSGRNAPEQNAEGGFLGGILKEIKSSDVGANISSGISGIFNNVGGAVNRLSSGIGGAVGEVSGAIDDVTSSVGLGNLGTAAVGGMAEQGLGMLGGAIDLPGNVGSIISGLSGLSGFQRRGLGHIVLYMPHQINESYRANWSAQEIGQLGAIMLQGSNNFKGGMGAWDVFKAALDTGKGAAAVAGLQKAAGIVGQESLINLYLRESGKQAINPHMEQFFTGVEFRTFNFTFKFSPRNPKEAREVQSIIRAFKFYAAPAHYGGGKYGAFWQYPNEFGIEYWNSDRLHKIKKCACTSVDVNYAGSGTNSTFYDGHPVETDITLTFVELSQMTKGDFQQVDGRTGGY